jgi:hypothetical protein
MTIIGGGTTSTRGDKNALMRLREGTGGSFGNVVLANAQGRHVGVEIKDCGSEMQTQALPEASVSIGTAGTADSGYLYFSGVNVIHNPSTAITFDTANGCTSQNWGSINADPGFTGNFTEAATTKMDVRPSCGSAAYIDIQPLPTGNTFYDEVGYKGAFGNENWLAGWSYLAVTNRLATHELNCAPGAAAAAQGIPAWGTILFIVVAALLLFVCVFVCIVIQREKVKKPIFMPFETNTVSRKDNEAI